MIAEQKTKQTNKQTKNKQSNKKKKKKKKKRFWPLYRHGLKQASTICEARFNS